MLTSWFPKLFAVTGVAAFLATAAPAQEVASLIEPVSDAEILDPPASDWLMFRGNLSNWGYSPLDRIDRENVHQLDLAWSFSMEKGPLEATPLVRNGVVFVPNPGDVIHALDAATGDLIWEYRREWPEELTAGRSLASAIGKINRSLALYGDSIYATTGDAKVIRINATTGELVWESTAGDYNDTTHTTGPSDSAKLAI